jgi:UMF1 family MFS transporter
MLGYITVVTGNVRYGILSILILFIIGGFLLIKVDIEEGEKMAKEYLSN